MAKSLECIDEASCEESLLSSLYKGQSKENKDYENNTPQKTNMENDMFLDLSRISNIEYSTERGQNPMTDRTYNDEGKTNEFKENYLKFDQVEDHKNDQQSENNFDHDFYENEFLISSPQKEKPLLLQDPMKVLYGDNYENKDTEKAVPQNQLNTINMVSPENNNHSKACFVILKHFQTSHKLLVLQAFRRWHLDLINTKHIKRVNAASAMVDKMSKFSKNFIAVHSMNT